MQSQKKIIVFLILLNIVSVTMVVLRYETLLTDKPKQKPAAGTVVGGAANPKTYTATEVIGLIRSSKEYIGDSVTIFENGKITTSNSKFQGTLNAVINTRANMDAVNSAMDVNLLPVQYNIYILAATYYRQQYPEEFK